MTKQEIYDLICRILADYEDKKYSAEDAAPIMYSILVDIQNNWESVITKGKHMKTTTLVLITTDEDDAILNDTIENFLNNEMGGQTHIYHWGTLPSTNQEVDSYNEYLKQEFDEE